MHMAIALLCLGCLLAPQSADQILRLGDDRVEVTARGALGPRVLPRGRPAGDAKPRVWRARVRIAADLRVGARRTTMDAAAVAKVRDAFATFGRMVNAWSRGRVRIDADIAVMDLVEGKFPLMDSKREVREASQKLYPIVALRDGRLIPRA